MKPHDSHCHNWAVSVLMWGQPSIGRLMQVEGPAPDEQLNEGEPTEPRQAASVIVLRGGGDGLEVLLLRRNPDARFMGGVWVFPGGAVDAHEGEGDAAH